MFNEQEVQAYQGIRAPETLRSKVLAAKKPVRQWNKVIPSLAAACLVLVVAGGFLFRGGEPDIVINGEKLKSSIVYHDLFPAAEMRSAPDLTVPMELELSGTAVLRVTHGQLTLGNQTAAELTASGDVELLWQIPREGQIPLCQLHIDDGKDVTTITLEYKETQITITKKGE